MKLNTEINCIIGSEYEHLYKWQYPSLEERASSEKVNGACSNVSLFLENELLELIEQCQYASQTESPQNCQMSVRTNILCLQNGWRGTKTSFY